MGKRLKILFTLTVILTLLLSGVNFVIKKTPVEEPIVVNAAQEAVITPSQNCTVSRTLDTNGSNDVDAALSEHPRPDAEITTKKRSVFKVGGQGLADWIKAQNSSFDKEHIFTFTTPAQGETYYNIFNKAGGSAGYSNYFVCEVSSEYVAVDFSLSSGSVYLTVTAKKDLPDMNTVVNVYVCLKKQPASGASENLIVRLAFTITNSLKSFEPDNPYAATEFDRITEPVLMADKTVIAFKVEDFINKTITHPASVGGTYMIRDTSRIVFSSSSSGSNNYFDLNTKYTHIDPNNAKIFYVKADIGVQVDTEVYTDFYFTLRASDNSSVTIMQRVRITAQHDISLKTSFKGLEFNYSNAVNGKNAPIGKYIEWEKTAGKKEYYYAVKASDIFQTGGGDVEFTSLSSKPSSIQSVCVDSSDIYYYDIDEQLGISVVNTTREAQKVGDYLIFKPKDNGMDILRIAAKTKSASSGITEETIVVNVFGFYERMPIEIVNKKDNYFYSKDFAPSHDGFTIMENSEKLYSAQVKSLEGKVYVSYVAAKQQLTVRAVEKCEFELDVFMRDGNGNIVTQRVFFNIAPTNFFMRMDTFQRVLFLGAIGLVAVLLIILIIALIVRRHRKHAEEIEQQKAPTSSYLVKLNTAIASQQAMRMTQPALAASPAQAPIPSSNLIAAPATPLMALAAPAPAAAPGANPALIPMYTPPGAVKTEAVKDTDEKKRVPLPISDEELIERIFVEKYEPKGMSRRSFFKSRDLQMRELEKEKDRIYDEIEHGVPIEKACMSDFSIESLTSNLLKDDDISQIQAINKAKTSQAEDDLIRILNNETAQAGGEVVSSGYEVMTDTEAILAQTTDKLAIAIVQCENFNDEYIRLINELDKAKDDLQKKQNELLLVSQAIAAAEYEIVDLDIKATTSKNKKEKDDAALALVRKEDFLKDQRPLVPKLESEIETKKKGINILDGRIAKTQSNIASMQDTIDKIKAKMSAQQNALISEESVKKVKNEEEQKARNEKAALEAEQYKISDFKSLLLDANLLDEEIKNLNAKIDNAKIKRDRARLKVSENQDRILETTDMELITKLSNEVSENNNIITECDKKVFDGMKERTDKNVLLLNAIKKANEFANKNGYTIEDLIKYEDQANSERLKRLNLDFYSKEHTDSELALQNAQAEYEKIMHDTDTEIQIAAKRAIEDTRHAEEVLRTIKDEYDLNKVAQSMASDDDERTKLMMEELELMSKIEDAEANLDRIKAQGLKNNLDEKQRADKARKQANADLEAARKRYEKAIEVTTIIAATGEAPIEYEEGSGVVANDRKSQEIAELRKKYDRTADDYEKKNLQDQINKLEAEKAVFESQRATDDNKEALNKLLMDALARLDTNSISANSRLLAAEKEAKNRIAKIEEEARLKNEALEAELKKAKESAENDSKLAEGKRIQSIIDIKKREFMQYRSEASSITREEEGKKLLDKINTAEISLKEEEKTAELTELIEKVRTEAKHATEIAALKELVGKKDAPAPRNILRKVTEKVNFVPRGQQGGQRSGAAARPGARPGMRPAGARPMGARPGAPMRPAGARPGAASSSGLRAAPRPIGAAGTAASGLRPTPRPVGAAGATSPSGLRPTPRPVGAAGATPASGLRPTPRPIGTAATQTGAAGTTPTRPTVRPAGTAPARPTVRPAGTTDTNGAAARPTPSSGLRASPRPVGTAGIAAATGTAARPTPSSGLRASTAARPAGAGLRRPGATQNATENAAVKPDDNNQFNAFQTAGTDSSNMSGNMSADTFNTVNTVNTVNADNGGIYGTPQQNTAFGTDAAQNTTNVNTQAEPQYNFNFYPDSTQSTENKAKSEPPKDDIIIL